MLRSNSRKTLFPATLVSGALFPVVITAGGAFWACAVIGTARNSTRVSSSPAAAQRASVVTDRTGLSCAPSRLRLAWGRLPPAMRLTARPARWPAPGVARPSEPAHANAAAQSAERSLSFWRGVAREGGDGLAGEPRRGHSSAPGSWLLAPGSWLLAPGSWLLAPGSWLLAPGSWLLAPGSWLLAPGSWLLGSWLLAPGSWLLAPGSWLLAPGSWLLAPGSWLLAPGSWLLAPGSWLLAPGSWLLAPGSWLLAPGSWLLAPGSWLLAQNRRLKTRAGCQVFCRDIHTVFLGRCTQHR